VLAGFQSLPTSITRVHPMAAELGTVRAALEQVAPIWPSAAAEVAHHLSGLVADVDTDQPPVLCHGDFTPAQLLLEDGVIRGLVDLDTVCWADPALDVGRFLAHADLAIAKATGEPGRATAGPLADSLLRGYLDAAPQAFARHPPLPRLAAYRALSLARSALRACRQLKTTRAQLALSVLRTADSWTKGVSP
jgi:aminoglycoside phosphotransferase (APT) family kinase protein